MLSPHVIDQLVASGERRSASGDVTLVLDAPMVVNVSPKLARSEICFAALAALVIPDF